jgi:glycosyltransferase involved in cell wall biosynthesis
MADLFISCSAYEGMPLAPLEAAGSGLPLVLSAIPGHDFLKQESYQFPLSDLEKGAACIEEALSWVETEGEGYQAKLWESRKSIRERFSIQSMANQYSALYDAAIR